MQQRAKRKAEVLLNFLESYVAFVELHLKVIVVSVKNIFVGNIVISKP